MKPQKQRFIHSPDDKVYGDCHRTAVACLLDMDRDDVPHFLEGWPPIEVVNAHIKAWLKQQGYMEWTQIFGGEMQLADVMATMKHMNPGIYYLLGGTSKNGTGHTVVCLEDRIIWDPALDDSGIVAPLDNYWWISVLVSTEHCCQGA